MAIIPGTNQNIVIDTPARQKTRRLVLILVAVAIIIGLVIYFGFGGGGSTGGQPPITGQPAMTGQPAGGEMLATPITTQQQIDQSNKILESLKNISLLNPVFTDKKFQSLILSDQIPVVSGTKGRENPFSPF
ncbi:hypothetical protein KKF25_01720 [Patescibacteria group bacterium]|nr:hypothetical protein [Patescibacteria group bacterium]